MRMARYAVNALTLCALSGAVSLCAVGCSAERAPIGQLELFVDTDALVPFTSEDGTADAGLFDTLVVDVYRPGEGAPCEGCSRSFAVDRAAFLAREVSFGAPQQPGVVGYVARLRLYHSGSTVDGGVPAPVVWGPAPSVIERWVALPPVEEEGLVRAHVVLETASVGYVAGTLGEPLPVEPGRPPASRVGTWPPAGARACSAPGQPGDVCVPGGAYWMGNPRALGFGVGDAWTNRRLVALSPFYMDAVEVTVADWRGFDPTGAQTVPWSGDPSGNAPEDFCTFTPEPSVNDSRPIVCLTRESARQYCLSQGKDLPTEAQLEYVASGLSSRLFVWGADEPACPDAVITRYGYGLFDDFGGLGCLPDVPPGGVEAVGAFVVPPRRDRLELVGGTIYDLVGNATEWVRDAWNRQNEPCWAQPGVFFDPFCEQPSPADGPFPVFRLGSFAVGGRQAIAGYRSFISEASTLTGNGVDLGFRCVRSGL
jgi:formylglycine-generating enzyme required for sulfatase activity